MSVSNGVNLCDPPPPTSTSRVHRRHHVIGVPRLPRFSRSSASVYYTERKPKNKKRGRPGNEASKQASRLWHASQLVLNKDQTTYIHEAKTLKGLAGSVALYIHQTRYVYAVLFLHYSYR